MAHHRHHMAITRKDIAAAERHLKHRRDPGSSHSGKMAQFTQSATIGGTTFMAGLLKGYFGPMMVGASKDPNGFKGIPAELLAFLGVGVLAASGAAGKHSGTLANVADGIGAGYLHTLGAGLGDQMFFKKDPAAWKARANPLLANESFAGALGSGSQPLSRAELRAMASAVRGR